jgi:hypothetical protein
MESFVTIIIRKEEKFHHYATFKAFIFLIMPKGNQEQVLQMHLR